MARFIIMPQRGVRAETQEESNLLAGVIGSNQSTAQLQRRSFVQVLQAASQGKFDPFEREVSSEDGRRGGESAIDLIDALHEDGSKLVEMDAADAEIFASNATLARILPVLDYDYNPAPPIAPVTMPADSTVLTLHLRCAKSAKPVPNTRVTLLTDASGLVGHECVSDANGLVQLAVGPSPVYADLLYVAPPAAAHWGWFERGRNLHDGETLLLPAIDPQYDPIAALRASPACNSLGLGVSVAVIDSGIGPHPDIALAHAENTVTGEPRDLGDDNGLGHGTHVAGIIGGRGAVFRGIAPDAAIHCFRVGGSSGEMPTSYSIMKALDHALEKGCDVINLSLSTVTADDAVREAIRDVNARGSVVIAASGNGWREAIAEPARFIGAIAVAAYGDELLFPPQSDAARFVALPGNPEKPNEFVAGFSNVAKGDGAMGLIAPGVGIVSLALGSGYRQMSGTSMATAVVSAQVALLLAQDPGILSMPRDSNRSTAIRKLVFAHAATRGFGMAFEGYGVL